MAVVDGIGTANHGRSGGNNNSTLHVLGRCTIGTRDGKKAQPLKE
jgi:hypothetical protein